MKKLKGILYTITSAVAFGIMPILAKIAYSGGTNAFTLVFLRAFFAVFILLGYFLFNKIDFKINNEQVKSIALLGLGYTFTTLTLFISYNYVSVGLATTLHFIYPILVTVVSIILFKEKICIIKIFALLFSAVGIFLLIGKGDTNLSFKGIFLALLSGVFYSYYILGIAHSKIKELNSFVLTFYLSTAAVIYLLSTGIVTNNLSFNMQSYSWIISIIIALLTSIIAVTLFQMGIKIIGPSNASILSTFEPIVSIILGVLILHENITIKILLGSIFIIMSVIIITISEKKNKSCNKHRTKKLHLKSRT
jgi:drug/metabolite transporter (DMT)-like permease